MYFPPSREYVQTTYWNYTYWAFIFRYTVNIRQNTTIFRSRIYLIHVSIFTYDVNMIESKCARSGCGDSKHHGFFTDVLFQHALVKSLQRLDKAGLEIKEKRYQALILYRTLYKGTRTTCDMSKRRCVSVYWVTTTAITMNHLTFYENINYR
jgi:hypothetical protein